MVSENLIKGHIIELKVQEEMLRYGFDISIPSYNASRYDLIADTGKELIRIQVKKAIQVSNESFEFSCTTQNNIKSANSTKHKYTNEEIDYFATVWKDIVYLIPVDETSTKKTIKFDNTEYIAKNVLSSYNRMTDDELYNKSESKKHNCCIDCGRVISDTATRCISCYNLSRKPNKPEREELKQLIRNKSFTQIGKDYFVTDNAVRKWCDSYNLPRKKTEINKFTEEEWEII